MDNEILIEANPGSLVPIISPTDLQHTRKMRSKLNICLMKQFLEEHVKFKFPNLNESKVKGHLNEEVSSLRNGNVFQR